MIRYISLFVALLVSSAGFAAPAYKVEQKFGAKVCKNLITYLAVYKDKIYVLEKSGTLRIFETKSGKYVGEFDSGLKNTTALAMSPEGKIYVFSTITKRTPKIIKNRKYFLTSFEGVACNIFDLTGKKIKSLKLAGPKSATAARIIDGKLLVADQYQHALFILKAKTGKKIRIKKGFRLCCGLFDFCEGPNQTYVVANLGAFNVQQFNMKGKLVHSFGKRGRSLTEFHGCCNPVSLGYLPDGSLVTVEKDPTRVKIYDPTYKTAQQIEGLEELVKGCSYIPVAINEQGEIFLAASTKKYIVKCVPK